MLLKCIELALPGLKAPTQPRQSTPSRKGSLASSLESICTFHKRYATYPVRSKLKYRCYGYNTMTFKEQQVDSTISIILEKNNRKASGDIPRSMSAFAILSFSCEIWVRSA